MPPSEVVETEARPVKDDYPCPHRSGLIYILYRLSAFDCVRLPHRISMDVSALQS